MSNSKEQRILDVNQMSAVNLAVSKKSFFLTGKAGTGKSYTIKLILAALRKNRQNIVLTASTGAAAVLIDGRTIHSFGGFGFASFCDEEDIEDKIQKAVADESVIKRMKWVDTVIVDEISMLFDYLYTFERVARTCRGNNLPFGGIQVIAVGDFLQLPPVPSKVRVAPHPDLVGKRFAFELDLWGKAFKTAVILRKCYRQNDLVFVKMLDRIRTGKFTLKDSEMLKAAVKPLPTPPMIRKRKQNPAKRLKKDDGSPDKTSHSEEAEDEGFDEYPDPEWIGPTQFYPTKNEADAVNMHKLNLLLGEAKEFKAEHDILFATHVQPHQEKRLIIANSKFLKLYEDNPPCDPLLKLKVGAQVMLIRNLDVPSGLCNGARGTVTRFVENKPEVKFENGIVRIITPETWEQETKMDVWPSFTQIPLILAWGTSIHKAQGSSVLTMIGSMRRIFEDGQAYVLLSRAREYAGLTLLDYDMSKIKTNAVAQKFYLDLLRESGEESDEEEEEFTFT